jgi:restriction endonuclease S subunit
MKNGWQTKTLGEIGKVSMCKRIFKEETTATGEIPFYKIGTFGKEPDAFISNQTYNEYRAKYPFPKKGDVLISASGTIGRCVRYGGEPAYFQDSNIVWIDNDEKQVLNDYLYHFYGACEWNSTKGATISRLYNGDLRRIAIGFPKSLQEQQRIVGILDEAFEGIATARANAEKNLQNAHALFESHLQSVFTQRGDGWVEKRLGDESLLEIIDGDRGVNYPKATDFNEDGHCLFLNTKNVRPDGFDFESTMFITAEKDGQLRKGKLKRDDVVLTTRGTIGNIGLYSDNVPYEHIRINSGMLIFRLNKRALLPTYLFELLRSDIVKDQIRKQTTGAAQPQLPIKTLVNFVIPVPNSLDDQVSMVKKLRAFEPETKRLTQIYEQKLTALEALKKSLLHQAFSGEL